MGDKIIDKGQGSGKYQDTKIQDAGGIARGFGISMYTAV
jgi:hypothetical protein